MEPVPYSLKDKKSVLLIFEIIKLFLYFLEIKGPALFFDPNLAFDKMYVKVKK
jgi:hypothetical protein